MDYESSSSASSFSREAPTTFCSSSDKFATNSQQPQESSPFSNGGGENTSDDYDYGQTKQKRLSCHPKQEAIISQFTSITGCSYDQALQLLTMSNWQYQIALSIYFNEIGSDNVQQPQQQQHQQPTNSTSDQTATKCKYIANNATTATATTTVNGSQQIMMNGGNSSTNLASLNAPSNTPVTPPSLDYLEKAFSKLQTSNDASSSNMSNYDDFDDDEEDDEDDDDDDRTGYAASNDCFDDMMMIMPNENDTNNRSEFMFNTMRSAATSKNSVSHTTNMFG